MTLYYYIGSPKELPTGSFGQKKTIMKLKDALRLYPPKNEETALHNVFDLSHLYEQDTEVYETEEDAAGLYVSGPLRNEDTAGHFKYPYVYQADPNGGSYHISKQLQKRAPISYATGKKCLAELFSYLNRNLEPGEEAELFACWADNSGRFSEPRNRKLDLALDLNTFKLGEEFEWRQQQYILVKK